MAETIETVSLADEVRERFLRYAMSVVKSRALPDIRDGLKPVQRRILYSMFFDANLTFDRKAAKCAKIVGDVMGNYHPHGDSAIYEALVRMSQEWVMRLPLVHGEGNFGSVDGDPPAAYRYTEAKLTSAAEYLLAEIESDTVGFTQNYSGTKNEPIVLPAQYPNLLVNGSSGIAVGMATNIPPHNISEVLRACVYLIENPDATIAQLMDKVKGPDFPLGGKIVTDRASLRRIYEEGTGSIKMQGEWKLEELGKGKQQIVVTSIPYGVDKGLLENAIGGLIEAKKLPQLLSVSNETNDKEGMRIVLELKTGADPALVMAYLYKHTELQKNFSYNMTALVPSSDGRAMVPRDRLNLKEFLQYFLDFRYETIRRRLEFQLRKLRERIHILDGFRKVFNGLDKAIKLIRESKGKQDAAEKLMEEFDLDELQVNAILEIQLYKIAKLEINKILDELREKKQQAEEIETLLASKKKMWRQVQGELEKLNDSIGERRKSRMASDEDVLEFDETAYISRENSNVVITRDGWLKRVGRLTSVESTRVREGDAVIAVVPGSTLDNVIFFTDDGTAYTIRINEVPPSSGYGEPISKFFKLADGARVIAATTTDKRFTQDRDGRLIFVVTSAGNVVRLPIASFESVSTKLGRRFIKLEENDKVATVAPIAGEVSVMIASDAGHIIHFLIEDVSQLNGPGKGVIGIKLDDGEHCLGGTLIGKGSKRIVLETESGKIQDFGPTQIELQSRGGVGKKPGQRTRFVKLVPADIELVNWDILPE